MMKTFHYMKMHCVARCPCLIIRWYHTGTDSLGRLLLPVWGCCARWTADPQRPVKGLVIRGASCKKLLTNIRGTKQPSVCMCVPMCVCVFVSGTGWDGCRLTAAICSHAGKFTHGSRCVTSLISSFSHWPGPWFVCRIRWWVMAPVRLSSPSVRDSSHSLLHSLTITWRPKKVWHHLPTKAFFLN